VGAGVFVGKTDGLAPPSRERASAVQCRADVRTGCGSAGVRVDLICSVVWIGGRFGHALVLRMGASARMASYYRRPFRQGGDIIPLIIWTCKFCVYVCESVSINAVLTSPPFRRGEIVP
jgi:hypothetical protein